MNGQTHEARATNIGIVLGSLGLVLLLCSCSSASGERIVTTTREARVPQTIADLIAADPTTRWLDDAALLSAAAYDDVGSDLQLPNCERVAEQLRLKNGQWKEKKDWAHPAFHLPSKDRDASDLFYRVWSNSGPDGSTTVVVAFRGTRFSSLRDWVANFRYVSRFIPPSHRDHYDDLREETPRLLQAIEHEYPGAGIIAAGHSLGGGLAQAFAYRSCGRVRTVFAFNPSVVTDKVEAREACREERKDLDALMDGASIYRVFERGEVLYYVRWIFSKFRELTPLVTMVKYNVRGSILRPIGEHSMKPFACELLARHSPHETPPHH